jgi:S-adenosylmethionine:tRNA ribosyltransferase-isomerase
MKRQDFNYHLPAHLIAQHPQPRRDASRLFVLDAKRGIHQHLSFRDLPSLIDEKDLLILNNTKVIPARLYAYKESGGKVEILVERVISQHEVLAHVGASKAIRPGMHFIINEDIGCQAIEKRDECWLLHFTSDKPMLELLDEYGCIPLPPYIKRSASDFDSERYQTIYARECGAVAAPTAGLHFTPEVMQQLRDKKVRICYVTLHVGAGTFQPVRVDDIMQHKMHSEYYSISQEVCNAIKETKASGGRVIAVGTTTVRSIESLANQGDLNPYSGETDIFIYPGYQFKVIDAMLTNFHLPESTLLMLLAAFTGLESILNAYKEAIAMEYRFFSYGDAMFVTRS